MLDKTSLVRDLVPKSYHFDGYNELNCPSPRDKPFFSENGIHIGKHFLNIRQKSQDEVILEFSSICPNGKITFTPYTLTFDDFVKKLQEAVQNGSDFIHFEIEKKSVSAHSGLEECQDCPDFLPICSKKFLNNQVETFTAAVSFRPEDLKEALLAFFQITKKNYTSERNITMKNKKNLFGMNFEFGLSKDPNLTSTLMGVAVRNSENGSWYVYDNVNNTLKNIAGMKMGSFPVVLIPSTTVGTGDLIKYQGKYFRVKGFNPSAKTITLIGAADGIISERVPEESIFAGMTMYTKVVAFDAKSLTDQSSHQNISSNLLAAMCMMQWSKGDTSEFSLDNINDDSFNGLGMCMPMLLMNGGGSIGNMFTTEDGKINFPMLMALGATDDSSSSMMQTLVISQLLGGGTNNSPFAGIMGGAMLPTTSEEVTCEKCSKVYPAGTNFCPKCGGKTKSVSTTCRKCGAQLMKDATFCHKCGAKALQNTCPKCGQVVTDDASFCSKCGTPINAEISKEDMEALLKSAQDAT